MITDLFIYLIRKKPTILKIVLIALAFSYFLMAILPKHADFWILNYVSAPFWSSPLHFYSLINEVTAIYPPAYPPTFYALQGAWIGLGSLLFHMNITGIYVVEGASLEFYSLWAIIPTMVALYAMVFLAYFTLDNKWLTIICFAPITFVAVIIMGQNDIFPTLFIFISLILVERAFKSDKYITFLLLAFISLGISLQFKVYGAFLFPAYILYILALGKVRKIDRMNTIFLVTCCCALFFIAMFIVWIPYGGGLFQKVILGGHSKYVFQNSIFNGISPWFAFIWLLGYVAIVFCMIKKLGKDPEKFVNDGRYFVFFNFLIITWFFISLYTHPQWWLLLVPFMLMALDRFKTRIGYILCVLIMVIFPLFPMMNRFKIVDNLILLNVPVVVLNSESSMIVIMCLASLLMIWSFVLFKELRKIDTLHPL